MIQIKNLTKTYGSAPDAPHALDDVSIDVADGDIIGIIGMSGAGKSTLVRCINLLERPDSGQILVDGQDVTGLTGAALRAYRRRVAMIFQNFGLLAQKTVLANVCFPYKAATGRVTAENRERALELLDMVGLRDRADSYPSQLSGGQQQRVAIARALACDPEYILCDEATSALDPASTNTVLKLLRQINRETGVSQAPAPDQPRDRRHDHRDHALHGRGREDLPQRRGAGARARRGTGERGRGLRQPHLPGRQGTSGEG